MDREIRKQFQIFCETFLVDKGSVNNEDLYCVFKYAYLKGRKDYIEEIARNTVPLVQTNEYKN